MKRFLLVFLFLHVFIAKGQQIKPVAQKVNDYALQHVASPKYELFTEDLSHSRKTSSANYAKAADGVSVFGLNASELSRLLYDKPEGMELSFPFEGKTLTLQLVKNNILTEDFIAESSDAKPIGKGPGVYYQGILKGDNTSLAAVSFSEDDVIGLISIREVGNIVLGKAQGSQDFVTYNDIKLKNQQSFECGAKVLPENALQNFSFDPSANVSSTKNCVRVYLEGNYKIYELHQKNPEKAIEWMKSMFNLVQTIFSNDGIRIALSDVYVWTVPDPFVGPTFGDVLNQFSAQHKPFNADVAQLLHLPWVRGNAYVNVLCNKAANYSLAGMDETYENLPTISSNINVMAHELGHNLGSPHTQACAWNGNNTAIDGCEQPEGNCPRAEIPTDGGTIMSYCGYKNYSKGFGDQPAALIRNTVDRRACLGTNCATSCTPTVTNLTPKEITQNSFKANFMDALSAKWKYSLSLMDGTVVKSGETLQKEIAFTGLSPATYYRLGVGNLCSGAYDTYRLVLTNTSWCGKTFTDTGGISQFYGAEEYLVKTFYPDNPAQKLSLKFSDFKLMGGETWGDKMTIFNGDSEHSPVFHNGEGLTGDTIPPSTFVSTHSTGAITVRFYSDGGGNEKGWVANISCATLSVDETADKDGIKVHPNPTQNLLTVEAQPVIEEYSISDMSGRTISGSVKVKSKNFTIDFSRMSAGVYFVIFKTGDTRVVKKIIRK